MRIRAMALTIKTQYTKAQRREYGISPISWPMAKT